MAKLLIAGGILVAGDNPLGWRIASVVFGVAGCCRRLLSCTYPSPGAVPRASLPRACS